MEEEYSTKDVIEQINFMNDSTPEEMKMIYADSFKLYLLSLYKFGKNSMVTKDCLNVAREFKQICRKEKEIFKYILKNINDIDVDKALDYLDMLDKLNEKTYLYYDRVLGDIEYALSVKDPNRAKRIRKEFDTLTDSDKYEEELSSLIIK